MMLLDRGRENGLSKSKEMGESITLCSTSKLDSNCCTYVTSLPDWTEMYPVHKFSCEGDGEGIRRCLLLGMDPDEKDTDSWTPLHYACWYI